MVPATLILLLCAPLLDPGTPIPLKDPIRNIADKYYSRMHGLEVSYDLVYQSSRKPNTLVSRGPGSFVAGDQLPESYTQSLLFREFGSKQVTMLLACSDPNHDLKTDYVDGNTRTALFLKDKHAKIETASWVNMEPTVSYLICRKFIEVSPEPLTERLHNREDIYDQGVSELQGRVVRVIRIGTMDIVGAKQGQRYLVLWIDNVSGFVLKWKTFTSLKGSPSPIEGEECENLELQEVPDGFRPAETMLFPKRITWKHSDGLNALTIKAVKINPTFSNSDLTPVIPSNYSISKDGRMVRSMVVKPSDRQVKSRVPEIIAKADGVLRAGETVTNSTPLASNLRMVFALIASAVCAVWLVRKWVASNAMRRNQ